MVRGKRLTIAKNLKHIGGSPMQDITSLTHTKWRCQYHIVFAPKYRRKIVYGKYRVEIGKILRKICERMDGVEIIEANACIDHLNLLC